MPEGRQRHAAGPALIDHGGGPGAHTDEVRIEPKAPGYMLEDVGVGVDHARQHELTGDVHDLRGLLRRNGRSHGRDTPILNRDVAGAMDAGSGVDDCPALQQAIILMALSHDDIASSAAWYERSSHSLNWTSVVSSGP